MLLNEADIHLEYSRLLVAQKSFKEARARLALAQELIAKTGYALRAPEVAALTKQLAAK